jgi:hypothetical protein
MIVAGLILQATQNMALNKAHRHVDIEDRLFPFVIEISPMPIMQTGEGKS